MLTQSYVRVNDIGMLTRSYVRVSDLGMLTQLYVRVKDPGIHTQPYVRVTDPDHTVICEGQRPTKKKKNNTLSKQFPTCG
jgi:hypothetical protein